MSKLRGGSHGSAAAEFWAAQNSKTSLELETRTEALSDLSIMGRMTTATHNQNRQPYDSSQGMLFELGSARRAPEEGEDFGFCVAFGAKGRLGLISLWGFASP